MVCKGRARESHACSYFSYYDDDNTISVQPAIDYFNVFRDELASVGGSFSIAHIDGKGDPQVCPADK